MTSKSYPVLRRMRPSKNSRVGTMSWKNMFFLCIMPYVARLATKALKCTLNMPLSKRRPPEPLKHVSFVSGADRGRIHEICRGPSSMLQVVNATKRGLGLHEDQLNDVQVSTAGCSSTVWWNRVQQGAVQHNRLTLYKRSKLRPYSQPYSSDSRPKKALTTYCGHKNINMT